MGTISARERLRSNRLFFPNQPRLTDIVLIDGSGYDWGFQEAMSHCMTKVEISTGTSIYNVPNALTTLRFALAVAVMVLIPLEIFGWALGLFALAASTDWMDGYWARKYGQVTKLGRIFDPFVDKIIICGAFIALVAVESSGVASWMATVVVARELLVTSLRGMIEGAGGDFSAKQLGKWKMVLQCASVIAVLLWLLNPASSLLFPVSQVLLWSAILLTVYSGYDYTVAAGRVMRIDTVPPTNDG